LKGISSTSNDTGNFQS